MTDLRAVGLADLERDPQSFIARRAAQLALGPAAGADVSRFLLAMVEVKRGDVREVGRTVRFGCPIVVLLERTGAYFWLQDPQLGAAEASLVAQLARLLTG
jgi:hypothetical protein